MEPIEIFTAAVLIVGAIHGVVTASARFRLWWGTMFPKLSMKSADAATHEASLVSAAGRPQRSDWYVFFHCSDLVGKEPRQEKAQVESSVVHPEIRKQQSRRVSLRAGARR